MLSDWPLTVKRRTKTSYNGGMGSNGLTSARHDIFKKRLYTKYPESFDPEIDLDLVYAGSYGLTDTVNDMPVDMGKAVFHLQERTLL